MILFDLIASPEETLRKENASKRMNLSLAILGLLAISALDLYFVFKIGNIPGGNPSIWFILGALLDLEIIKNLSETGKWILYPIKILGDFAIIFLSGWIAYKFLGGKKKHIITWFKSYCYLAVILDLFFILVMQIALISTTQRYLIVEHLLTYMIFGSNMILFTNIYKNSFKLSFDKAYLGFFIATIAIPITIISFLLLAIK